MIGVTTITAYFLWKTLKSQQETLKSQKDVQDTQNKLYKIERIRLLEQFKPILKYSLFDNTLALNEISRESSRNKEVISIAIQNESDIQTLDISPLYNGMQGAEIWINKSNPTDLLNRTSIFR